MPVSSCPAVLRDGKKKAQTIAVTYSRNLNSQDKVRCTGVRNFDSLHAIKDRLGNGYWNSNNRRRLLLAFFFGHPVETTITNRTDFFFSYILPNFYSMLPSPLCKIPYIFITAENSFHNPLAQINRLCRISLYSNLKKNLKIKIAT